MSVMGGARADTRFSRIESALQAIKPLFLEIKDESDRHAGRAGTESHFRIRMVADVFEGVGRPERHRKIHSLLKRELDAGLHAVTLQLMTESEAAKLGLNLESPKCAGS